MQPNTASDAATQYIGFDARTNNTPVSFEGAANTAVKHVVGNGYAQTLLTGNVAPAAALTVSDLGLQNVTVTGGKLTLGDAYIPSGSTVAVSGGGLAVEKVTGAGEGSVIDLGKTFFNANASSVNVSGCTITGGSNSLAGGAFYLNRPNNTFTNCTISGNSTGTAGGAMRVDVYASNTTLTGCTITGNYSNYANGGGIGAYADITLKNCILTGNVDRNGDRGDLSVVSGAIANVAGGYLGFVLVNSGGKLVVSSECRIDKVGYTAGSDGTVTLTSGAILDLTGNTNATPIAPGGGITFASGGATVLYSSGAVSGSYMMNNVTLPAGAKLTNTAVVNLNSAHVIIPNNATATASGCVFSGGSAVYGGAFDINGVAIFNKCGFVGNSGDAGTAITMENTNANISLTSCTFSGNTGNNGAVFAYRGTVTLSDTVFSSGQNVVLGTSSASVILSNLNTIQSITGAGIATVTISSGTILDFTGNTNAKPINPGGAITIPAGAVVKIIGSDGPTSSAYLSELALTGTTITNVPSVLGATVTVPATGGPWEVHFVDSTSSIYSATGTERQEVLAGAVTYIGGQ